MYASTYYSILFSHKTLRQLYVYGLGTEAEVVGFGIRIYRHLTDTTRVNGDVYTNYMITSPGQYSYSEYSSSRCSSTSRLCSMYSK